MRDRLVVPRKADGIEVVQPVALLPAPVLREQETQLREAVRDDHRRLALGRLAVAGDRLAYGLWRVGVKRDAPVFRDAPGRERDAVEIIEPRHRMAVGLLHDERAGPMSIHEPAHPQGRFAESPILWQCSKRDDAVLKEPAAGENGVAEFSGARIDGEDGTVRVSGHGRGT